MLQIIRDRAQGVFAWIIVGMISIPFALWGINSYFGGGGDDGVAEVDGVVISKYQVQNAYQQQRQRLQQMFGGKLPENLFSEQALRQQVLQQLIEQELLVQAANQQRMRIGDEQLAATITAVDAFHEAGVFSPEQYERVLARQGMSPRLFEQRVRRDLTAAQLSELPQRTEFTLPSEVEGYLRLQQQQRDVGYMTLSLKNYTAGQSISNEEVRSYYDANSGSFMQAEQVSVDYLELKASDIAAAVSVDDKELRQRYEAQKINYRTPEERQARHILLTVSGGDDEKTVQTKAESLLQRLQNGESFSDVAKSESQDPGSAGQGGDLGFFGRDVMDKAFEETAFALSVGEVSEVVRSSFGFHIIKLEAIRGGESKSFDEVRETIRAEMQQERADEIFFNQAEQLANLTYEQPDTLNVAAEQLQLSVRSSEPFGRSGAQGVASHDKVIAAAFNEDVLLNGNNSEVLELAPRHLLVLRMKQHQPEALRPFETVQADIIATLKAQKAETAATEEAKNLLMALRSGKNGEALAKTKGLTWQEQKALQRDNKAVPAEILEVAFRMPHPQGNQPSSEQLSLANGDQVLLQVHRVSDGNSGDVATRQNAQTQLSRAASRAAQERLLTQLRASASVIIRE